jgi:multidrug resistance efflux pump
MKSIRARLRVDTLPNQRRSDPIRWGRRIYFAICAGLLLLLDYAFGDMVLLRAHGLVVNDRYVMAATYRGKIAAVRVKEGQQAAVGDVLMEIESLDILKDVAQLSTQNAELATREAQLSIRVAVARDLLPLAERHARESASATAVIDNMNIRGLINLTRMDQALGAEYATAARLAELKSEMDVLETQLPLIRASHRRAAAALRQLETIYDNGIVRAPRAGLVGSRVPPPGQVVKFGDELLQLHGQDSVVLAYLPETYLFTLEPEDRVTVHSGSAGATGTIEAILLVTDALPPEFQNMFRPRDRSRLLRVRLPEGHSLAVAQKVTVRGCVLGWC